MNDGRDPVVAPSPPPPLPPPPPLIRPPTNPAMPLPLPPPSSPSSVSLPSPFISCMHRSVLASSLKVTNAKPVQWRCRRISSPIVSSRSASLRRASLSRAWILPSCRCSRAACRSRTTADGTAAAAGGGGRA